jgi:hypothetical protein
MDLGFSLIGYLRSSAWMEWGPYVDVVIFFLLFMIDRFMSECLFAILVS